MYLSKVSGLLLLFLFTTTSSSSSSSPYFDLFESWCLEHNKAYASEAEKLARFQVFEDNLAFVESHNAAANSTYSLALNAFADLTLHEFRAVRLGLSLGLNRQLSDSVRGGYGGQAVFRGSDAAVPDSIDWREKGAVTQIKDQGSCGACWAFSATGAIEGINKIATGSLVSLSEQELIDCDQTYNTGCSGGLMDYAYNWVVKNHGIDTEEDYPYHTAEKNCLKNKLNHRVVTIDGYTDVPSHNEKLLLQAVTSQPVSVGISGSERAFQLYSKGIFTGPCSTSLDHAVLIVGYGSKNGVDYWILKNSWGTNWGINGYMHMLRNGGTSQGVCGINMLASYPTKTSPNPPPPSPGPTRCNLLTYCPSATTCCCTRSFLGLCFSWGCCELESAVCCKDHSSCCPQDYPVCDIGTKQCFKGSKNSTGVHGIKKKDSFLKFGSLIPFID
ncbi:low-temperature-induced cysteine proteinase [Dendrobium catenatum]|uniref:Oryzain alpha chain n=1 Tax=Dendrobium catenatum TaxID=906689 RepID=A0A2I0WY23_9ASPA|nr:low-temperature-induced cysteine proteinase [Dendrobium catenatum]PKU80559.1 Oryzain alpha chain [Dendrobium catenatum]